MARVNPILSEAKLVEGALNAVFLSTGQYTKI